MMGVLKVIREGVLIAGIFMLAISAQHSYAQDKFPDKVLDMARYRSAEEAQKAFNQSYAKGSDVCPVLEYLKKNAKKTSSPFEIRDFTAWGWIKEKAHQWNPLIQDDGFMFRIEKPHENADIWRIHIEHSGCNLVEAKFRLQYMDKNFAERGLPFRLEYFDDMDMVGTTAAYKALQSIIRAGSDDLSEVESIMYEAGITNPMHAGAGGKKRNLGNGSYGYTYSFWYDPKDRDIGKCAPWNIVVSVDDDKKIIHRDGEPVIVVNPPYCHSL